MKQNFKRFLNEEKHKLDQGMSNEIYNEVFSVLDGLLAAKNLEDFMARRIVFENKYGELLRKKYLKSFLDRLQKNAVSPHVARGGLGDYFR